MVCTIDWWIVFVAVKETKTGSRVRRHSRKQREVEANKMLRARVWHRSPRIRSYDLLRDIRVER